jgi:diguanylate cyclase (GGDEF)-like protein/PAS domain S-box-containing protein
MAVNFAPGESFALFRLLADNATDVLLKTDRAGFILRALPALEHLGVRLPGGPIGRHILDMVHPDYAAAVRAAHDGAIAQSRDSAWVEFPASTEGARERWFALRTRPLQGLDGAPDGAVSIVRSISERRSFEERLFAAAMTDPLTGLTNRSAFVAMLQHLTDAKSQGCLALFDIDHMRAINLRHGHSTGDAVLAAFADLLRAIAGKDDILSRIGGESFGVLLPGARVDHGEAICESVLIAWAEAGRDVASGDLAITASAGLAPIADSLDATMKAAELALTLAKARGRNRVELGETRPARLPARAFGPN